MTNDLEAILFLLAETERPSCNKKHKHFSCEWILILYFSLESNIHNYNFLYKALNPMWSKLIHLIEENNDNKRGSEDLFGSHSLSHSWHFTDQWISVSPGLPQCLSVSTTPQLVIKRFMWPDVSLVRLLLWLDHYRKPNSKSYDQAHSFYWPPSQTFKVLELVFTT